MRLSRGADLEWPSNPYRSSILARSCGEVGLVSAEVGFFGFFGMKRFGGGAILRCGRGWREGESEESEEIRTR